MSRETISPIRVDLGGATLIGPNTVKGITPSGEFSPEKRAAISNAMAYIFPLLRIDGTDQLKPRDDFGLLPYKTPTEFADTIRRRIPRLQRFAGHFTKDQSEQYFEDDAQLFRGITLGDVLVAAIVNDGRIVSTSHYQYHDAPAVTQATPYGASAADYAERKAHELNTANRILYALQLDTLGLSVDDVMGSILMSPVVVRFIQTPESRIDPYGYPMNSSKSAAWISAYAPIAGTPYVAAIPPFHVAEETTEKWAKEFMNQFGFDIKDVCDFAKKSEERHLGRN